MLTKEDIERRKPLWLALSDLWLDTEPNELTYKAIVREAIDSGYPFEEIEKIFSEEVAPVVYTNLHSVAGVWGAFDDEWLFGEIIKNLERQENNCIYRFWIKGKLGKYLTTGMVKKDWEIISGIYRSKQSL